MCAIGLGVGSPVPTAVADEAPPPVQTAVTSPEEAARVDNIPTPTLNWQPCKDFRHRGRQCAEVALPLDYDDPNGTQITVLVLKVPARKPDQRIGSLFINPGGPGQSAANFVSGAEAFLSPQVLERFDLIGMDPRGIAGSSPLDCYKDPEAAAAALRPAWDLVFPTNKEEMATFQKSIRTVGESCGSTGKDLASAMSTAQVARDMEVLRRAVGDDKLSYLGFSYGSYLGQVYANLFPDRVRAVAIDGVINPTEWLGTYGTALIPFGLRIGSGFGADHAVTTLMERCAAVDDCPLSNPSETLDRVLERLKKSPVTFPTEDGGEQVVTYQRFTNSLLGLLYAPQTVESVAEYIGVVDQLGTTEEATPEAEVRLSLGQSFLNLEEQSRSAVSEGSIPPNDLRISEGDRAQLHSQSRMMAVICSEGSHPSERVMRRLDRVNSQVSPYFGAMWYWNQAACASPAWKVRDEDAYRGPFNKVTSAPVLVVGNEFDPATNFHNAVEVAQMLPNSRLVLADNWGHIAYKRSDCVTEAVDSYLLTPEDKENIKCKDAWQPFTE